MEPVYRNPVFLSVGAITMGTNVLVRPTDALFSGQSIKGAQLPSIKSLLRVVVAATLLWFLWGKMSNTLPLPIANALEPLSTTLILTVSIVYFIGGFIKGISGIGMGLICVPVVSLLYNPAFAVSLVAIPLIITNFHQGVISANVLKTLERYSLLAVVMVVVMIATVFFSTDLSSSIVEWAVGASALVFVVLNLGIKPPKVLDRYDTTAQVITGCTAGVVGGVTGLVVIPLVIYIMARGIQKNQFVAVSGLLLFLSGVALLVGGSLNETLTPDMFILSALVSVPALVGTLIGESLRKWISENVFRKIVLFIVFGISVKTLNVAITTIAVIAMTRLLAGVDWIHSFAQNLALEAQLLSLMHFPIADSVVVVSIL